MTTISVKELRTKLPKILKHVEDGEEYMIIYRSKPIGELIPLRKNSQRRKNPDLYALLRAPFGELILLEGKNSVDLVREDRE